MKSLLALAAVALPLGAAQAAWTTAGDALDDGTTLTLSTAWLAPGDPDTPFNLSGTPAADIAIVEAAAGVAPYALDLGDDAATEGSVAWQTLAVAAGDTLSFDWAFASLDADLADHAFAVLGGQVFTLAAGPAAASGRFSHVFGGAAVLSFAVGVVDTVDVLGVSTLTVTDLALTPAVPEPGSLALMLAGGAALWARRRMAAGTVQSAR